MPTQPTRRPSKKNLADAVAAIQAAHPDAAVELWATDEHRIGLLPLIRRVWAPRGKRPVAPVQQRYQWLYVCGFVRPTTGETEWWLLPTICARAFGLMLAAFARDVGAGAAKHILLVLDGAGWHTGEEVHAPEGIHLHVLPSYSPELQPAEHLWPLTNEPLANRRFESLAALEAVQAERCLTLQEQPDLIRRHTLFHWWPTTA
jgi:transposase